MALSTSGLLPVDAFSQRLRQEQRRTERSRRSFVFLLIESERLFKSAPARDVSAIVADLLARSIRETDIRGWFEADRTIGVIFTEIDVDDIYGTADLLMTKIQKLLSAALRSDQADQIKLSFCVYPEDWNQEKASGELYPSSRQPKKSAVVLKRSIDVAGSLAAIVVAFPLFLAIAGAVKLTSKGPVFFRQQRLGRHGRPFVFLKFRSMKVDNDPSVHRDFVKSLINRKVDCDPNGGQNVFKLTSDSRITPIGRFLRRTSLDEIPQFLNVLSGEMSLVGPRPPIPYEVEAYHLWHRCRLMDVKPGITGLWQVSGRSRMAFDEMVRLDIRYARSWSIWMDIKILVQTPRAVLSGQGAY